MQLRRTIQAGLLAVSLALISSCSSDDSGSSAPLPVADNPGVKVTATADGFSSSLTSLDRILPLGEGVSTGITPSVYKLALVNFWWIKSDGTEVNILNPDESNPTYTPDRPLIIDFSQQGAVKELFSADSLTPGTYTGYKMQFQYIEMKLSVTFRSPSDDLGADEGDLVNAGLTPSDLINTNTATERTFRLYFNASGTKYWKKDFVVEADPGSGKWWWLRREVEDPDLGGTKVNFFVSVEDNSHPPGGAGPDNTVDLFDDPEFWGEEADYDDATTPIIVGTHSTAGGLSARLEGSFTIPEDIVSFYNIDLEIDISGTFSYYEPASTDACYSSLIQDVLDLGPDMDLASPCLGDVGLHPFLPRFTLNAEANAEDKKSSSEDAYQVPDFCADINEFEPAGCYAALCSDPNPPEFCSQYQDARSDAGEL